MKKVISIAIATIIFALPFSNIRANEGVGFLEALTNTYELESYKLLQSVYGDFKIDDYEEKADGIFRLSFSGNVNSENAFENNQYSRINAYFQINYNEGEYKPFDQLTLNASGEITSIANDGLYIRLNNINISAKGMDSSDLEEMNEALDFAKEFTNEWYRIPMVNLMDSANEDLAYGLGMYDDEEVVNYDELISEIEDIGLMEAVKEQLKYAITSFASSVIEPEEEDLIEKTEKLIDRVFETNFFYNRDIVSGRNIGFKFFTFNRTAVINLIKDLAEDFDETLTSYEISELRQVLNKFGLAGLYRINTDQNIIDNLKVKFTLKDIDALEEMHVNYRYKMSSINEAPNVSAPSSYTEIEDTDMYIPYANEAY